MQIQGNTFPTGFGDCARQAGVRQCVCQTEEMTTHTDCRLKSYPMTPLSFSECMIHLQYTARPNGGRQLHRAKVLTNQTAGNLQEHGVNMIKLDVRLCIH